MQSNDNHRTKTLEAFLVGFVYLNVYFVTYQISVSSRHMAVAFDIPVHNIGIYFDKLYSQRCFLLGLGSLLEYSIYLTSSLDDKVRKYFSIFSISVLVTTRFIFAIFLHTSKKLSLHAYIILNAEGLLHGCFQMSILAIAPQHTSVTDLSARISGLFMFVIQRITDCISYHKPLRNVKTVSWICTLSSTAAIFVWYYYLFHIDQSTNERKRVRETNSIARTGPSSITPTVVGARKLDLWSHFRNASSQLMLFGTSSLFKDFLYPGVLPYALLERDKSHFINLIVTLVLVSGSFAIYFVHEYIPSFRYWSGIHNVCWLLVIPNLVSLILSLMTIHTRKPLTLPIRGSRLRVLILTLCMMGSYCIMCPMGFVGVADYVYYKSQDKKGSQGLITYHNIMSLVYRFMFSKLSVGYNDTRVSLGYHLPKFRPNHKMSKHNLAWYFIRNTFGRAVKDTISDLRMDIEKYL
ncbi:conserved hypothetical protein [Theileria orientalis strain Shintoku]|uniref:Uncharacterized protein n=1 Tax=Theileria orientalis strain Shintoku TaxID=869250 RepID=J4DQ59_THEOR|nr:conserved hypothetical protein [Theileria orientalis strain Shintoku]BAM41884.1 conserved hypothetical protein [Theileria orientalis strain Shintoku]|eukprot:XP_009692185.1 conserved hypothetical protein [Theileria orientalis strain Shintoku]